MGATAIIVIDTDRQYDEQAIFEHIKNINKELDGKANEKIYCGINNYQEFYDKKKYCTMKCLSICAPAHIRVFVCWNYQPDICKDNKQTSYCDFGDSCNFLHDRSDYKHRWQHEQEWNE
ncbi:unnamed protein product [Rotaria sp. Silwood2]|nr:unnamed protein product [Rotaria sp. Silwood2]CAF4115667.1 unnamed protein product [Rotaria sp. Silwood2]